MNNWLSLVGFKKLLLIIPMKNFTFETNGNVVLNPIATHDPKMNETCGKSDNDNKA